MLEEYNYTKGDAAKTCMGSVESSSFNRLHHCWLHQYQPQIKLTHIY